MEGKEGAWWWWLRSPGRVNVKAVYIFGTDGIQKVEEKVSRWIDSTNFEFDQDRSVMFNKA